MPNCPDAIKHLIDRFARQSDQICSPDYNETLIRIDFINPLMAELGWDIENKQGYAEQYREVVHEDRVKVAGLTKAPDYSFSVGGQRKFFLEAKKPSVDIKNNWERDDLGGRNGGFLIMALLRFGSPNAVHVN